MYEWLKALHVIAVIVLDGRHALSAAAVRLSLRGRSRLKQSETFKVMERRLLKAIITPAMIVTWVLGLYLAWTRALVHGAAGFTPSSLLVLLMSRRARVVPPLREGFRRRQERRRSQKFYQYYQ